VCVHIDPPIGIKKKKNLHIDVNDKSLMVLFFEF